jgi:hypothetical protein
MLIRYATSRAHKASIQVQAGSLRPQRGKEARQIKIGLGSATEADPKKIEPAKTA